MKICKNCKIEKSYSEFHKMKGGVGGVRTVCKECRQTEKKAYNSLPYVKLKAAENYQRNKDSMRERLTEYYWTLTSQYHSYLKNAKKKNNEFLLSKDDCKQFYNTICKYCNTEYKGLGIDRVNNQIGYILSNCVPCCKICNWMKRDLSLEDFLNHIKKIKI